MNSPTAIPSRQRGIVLIASLLLLVVVTIMALSMFRGYGIQEKIAGNVREKNRALLAAESAEQYAEWWLANNTTSLPADGTCTALLNANIGQGQICNTPPTSVVTTPWPTGTGQGVGVTYTPPGMNVNTTASAGSFYYAPTFYITDLGVAGSASSAVPNASNPRVYQIDAYGYGGTPNAVAVVESTYAIGTESKQLDLP